MKKRFQLFLFILILGAFVLPFSVFAEDEPKVLSYETEITNWQPQNHLYITESSTFPTGAVSTWKLVCDDVDIPLTKQTGNVFANVTDECDSAMFVETVSFDNVTLTNLGLNTNSNIIPSIFDQNQSEGASLSARVKSYLFSSLETTYYPVHYYVLNTVDEFGNITGSPYIRDIYFSDEEEQKTTVQSLGQIHLPSYALHYTYQVKGNIANASGNFFITHVDNDIADVTYPYSQDGEDTIIPNLTLTQLSTIDANPAANVTVGYGVGNAPDPSYTIDMVNTQEGDTFDDRLQVGENTFYLEYAVSASLTADGSDTGLFYNLVPFVILIVLGGIFGFVFFYKKRKQKEVVLVDEEVL